MYGEYIRFDEIIVIDYIYIYWLYYTVIILYNLDDMYSSLNTCHVPGTTWAASVGHRTRGSTRQRGEADATSPGNGPTLFGNQQNMGNNMRKTFFFGKRGGSIVGCFWFHFVHVAMLSGFMSKLWPFKLRWVQIMSLSTLTTEQECINILKEKTYHPATIIIQLSKSSILLETSKCSQTEKSAHL